MADRKKRFLCTLLAAGLALGGCVGAEDSLEQSGEAADAGLSVSTEMGNSGEENEEDVTPAWMLLAEDEVTLDWYINYSWFTTPWGENAVSQKITEETGVSVRFLTPMGNENEKFNSLIASDSLPDLITLGWWEPQVRTLIDGGYVWALDDLAQLYDPTFFDVTDRWTVEWYRQSDGKIYGYPNSSYSIDDYREGRTKSNQTFLVRKDIYEAIGSPDMTTPEGFMNAVRKAAELFPTVNGEKLIQIGRAHV